MKIIILITLSYLLCRLMKSIWKAFIVGGVSYLLISFIIMTTTIPGEAKLNITSKSMSYFAIDTLAIFIVYFTIGLVIFLIFKKSNNQNVDTIESSAPKEKKDISTE